jgi:energy-coupling factor transporter ATP-binding protein EcfA2
MPNQGVWLLTAGNGAGKTSLLACLRRIGNPNAFPMHFPSSLESESLDNFSGASVTYSVNGDEVEYGYRGARWASRPRKNSHLLQNFGYPSVVYIGADADRLTPRAEDFEPRRTRPAATALIEAANRIFETDKFENLKTINLTQGAGNRAFLLRTCDDPLQYHSEKHFSLGELCVIKLIEKVRECPNQSLILIDELEMALHPKAQIQLYRYLEEVARAKRLTIIFSTHSVSLLKSVSHRRIIYLSRDETGSIEVVQGCFPTYAIGNITLGEEKAPDAVLYVEDNIAKAIVEPLVKLILQNKLAASNLFPDVRVIPIGGFDAVVQFLTQHGVLLPNGTRAFALLDNDVKVETVAEWQRANKYQQLADLDRLGNKIDYLPWTPEVGMVAYMRDRREQAERKFRETFGTAMICLDQSFFHGLNNLQGAELRRKAKKIVAKIADMIADSVGKDRDTVVGMMCQDFALDQFHINQSHMLRLFAPKIA